jgi:hypothetical protein
MESTVDPSYLDVDDLILYGVAHRFLCWLTDLIMRWTPEPASEQEAA